MPACTEKSSAPGEPNHHALPMAAAAGFAVDSFALYRLLLEISKLMREAIAADEPDTRDPRYAPGGCKHVPFEKASASTKDSRWQRFLPFWMRSRRSVGDVDASTMVGAMAVNALNPRGHGADMRRRVPDAQAMLRAILNDDTARERLKRAIATHERSATHVMDCVLRKRKANASYALIDAYHDLFLVKHPNRRDMIAATKNLVAYLYANVMAAGSEYGQMTRMMRSNVRGCEQHVVHQNRRCMQREGISLIDSGAVSMWAPPSRKRGDVG